MNQIRPRGLLSWLRQIGFSQSLTQTKYLYRWATLTGRGKLKPSFKKTQHTSHQQTPFRSFTYFVFRKNLGKIRHFNTPDLPAFLYCCQVFYEWSTTATKAGPTRCYCIENCFDVFLREIFRGAPSVHTCISAACALTPHGNGLPRAGTAANEPGRSCADSSTICLRPSLSPACSRPAGRSCA